MPTVAQLYNMTTEYANGLIGADQFRTWLFEATLSRFPREASAASLADKIEGLMAESSHAGWTESDLREELANAVLPFEPKPLKSERVGSESATGPERATHSSS